MTRLVSGDHDTFCIGKIPDAGIFQTIELPYSQTNTLNICVPTNYKISKNGD